MGVTTIALIDFRHGDPDLVDLPIPGNDDSIRSIEVVLGKLADACLEGRRPAAGTAGMVKPPASRRAQPWSRQPARARGTEPDPGPDRRPVLACQPLRRGRRQAVAGGDCHRAAVSPT